jgi:excisionase family DNA binding protein
MDDLLTVRQLQELLKIDRTTIYRMLNDGRLTGIKVGGQWRFARQEIEGLLSGLSADRDNQPSISTDILPLHCLQAIQNVFAEIAGVGSITTASDGEPLTTQSNSCHFCNLMQHSESGRQACIDSWRQLAAQSDRRPTFTTCHAGLQYARARIEIDGALIAVLIAGQFYAHEPDRAEESQRLRQLAARHKIDPASLAEAARQIAILDDRMRQRIGQWLEDVAHTFEDIGHERTELMSRLRRIAAMSTLEAD